MQTPHTAKKGKETASNQGQEEHLATRRADAHAREALMTTAAWTTGKLTEWTEQTAEMLTLVAQKYTELRMLISLAGLTHWEACAHASVAQPAHRGRHQKPRRNRNDRKNAPAAQNGAHGRTGMGTRMPRKKSAEAWKKITAEGIVGKSATRGQERREGNWRIITMRATQQQGSTCGAHCALNSQTHHKATKSDRRWALRKIIGIWTQLHSQREISEAQARGESVSVGSSKLDFSVSILKSSKN